MRYSIKNKRIKLGWSQEKLAEESTVSRATISQLEMAEETGEEVVTTTETLINLSKALGCSVSDIFLPVSSNILDKTKEV